MSRPSAVQEPDNARFENAGFAESDGAERGLDIAAVAHELRVVIGQLRRRLRAEYTFPISQLTVLGQLDRDGPSTTSNLAAAEQIRPQSMAQTVADLEAAQLVTRRPDPVDGRQVIVALTPLGRETLAYECSERDSWLAQTLSEGFTEQEQAALADVLPLLVRLTLP